MKALRKVVKLNNNLLKLNIPVNFQSKYVEIIILPVNNIDDEVDNDELLNTDFQNFLLSGPVMSNEDFNYFLDKKKHFNQWK